MTFQNPQGAAGINGVLNAAYPGYPSFNPPSYPQSMPVTGTAHTQPPQLAMGYHQASQNIPQQQPQAVYNQFQQQAQQTRPLMASSPMGSSQSEAEVGGQRPIRGQDDATRMNMRRQMDVATAAGMKCSQF